METFLVNFNLDIFQSSIFSKELIDQIWEGGFLDYDVDQEMFDLLNDNFFYVESLLRLRDYLISAVKKSSVEECNAFWSAISVMEGFGRQMMTVLAFLIDSAKQTQSSIHVKDASIISATVYLTLIRFPGCSSVQFFHPVIFQKCMETLKHVQVIDKKEKSSKKQRSSGSKGSQRSASSGRAQLSQGSEAMFEEDNEEVVLTDHDRLRLKQRLTVLLQSLVSYLQYDPLRTQQHLSESVISLLGELTRVDPSSFSAGFEKRESIEKITSICHLSYRGILILCKRNEGLSLAMVKKAFMSLQQNLLMLVGQRCATLVTIPREVVMIRDQALDYVFHMMKDGGDNVGAAVYRLVKSILLSTPDRSEYRVKVCQSVMYMMERMSDTYYCETCKWLYQLSKYKKVSGRMLAVEILGPLLTSSNFRKIEESSSVETELIQYTNRTVLLQALLIRCSDKAPSVMAKALSMVAACLSCEDKIAMREIRGFITSQCNSRVRTMSRTMSCASTNITSTIEQASTEGEEATNNSEMRHSNFTRYEFTSHSNPTSSNTFYLTRGFDITLADSEGLVSLIRRRLQFPKAVVRKSALLALESVIVYNSCINMCQELEALKEHCRDVGVPIRKQAIQSLTRMLQLYPTNHDVQVAWLTGVLPAYDDNESSVQEKCWESIKSVLLDVISGRKDGSSGLAWQLCAMLNEERMMSLRGMLYSVCVQLHKRGELQAGLVKTLASFISSEHCKEAWLLLSIISPVISTKDGKTADIIASQWLDSYDTMDQSVVVHALTTISTLAAHSSESCRQRLIADLLARLKTYSIPVKYIKYMVVAVSQLMLAVGADGRWVKDMTSEIEQFLTGIVYANTYNAKDVDCIPNYLLTLGEICIHNPHALSQRLIQIVQSMLVLSQVTAEQNRPGFIADMASGSLPASLRHAALLCLGQICLQHEAVAKLNIPLLVKELETTTNTSICKAIVITLCDLCRLYTNAVGPYVSSISSSLKNKDADVRRSTFISMTRLLQEDFLKWSGSLFYRFISCVVDDDTAMAELAKQTFVYELSKRNKAMYMQHFVECVFYFNNYTTHKSYNKFPQMDSERAMFSLAGETNDGKRQQIYNFMLDQMTDSQKFTTTERLCQDIMAAAIEKEISLDTEAGAAILVDALRILQSKNIKLSVTRPSTTDALLEDDMSASQASSTKATAAVVSKIVRKNFVETVVPEIISLKALLESIHSPSIKHLMLFLIEITKDYKTELADILAGNDQLSTELAFDIRKFEEMQALELAQQTANVEETIPQALDVQQDVVVSAAVQTPVLAANAGAVRTPSNTLITTPGNTSAVATPTVATPRLRAISGTPAMPPPPLRSALKKPMTTTRQLANSAKKMAHDRATSNGSGSSRRMTKRVNFDEEDEENHLAEEARQAEPSITQTPLQPMISGAIGARAISTPDGHLADLTFAGNTSLRIVLSPIDMFNSTSGGINSARSAKSRSTGEDDTLGRAWNLKSPAQQKSGRRKAKPPTPVDMEHFSSTAPPDQLGSIPLSTRAKSRTRRAGKKYK